MATLSQLIDQRERLIEAASSGARRVRDSDGSEIEYRSQAELQAALRMINQQIAQAESELGCSRVFYPNTSKGLR